ncbi:TIGR02679 domain-containing protein [Enterococcus faecalis]|uniref:TIGR02679 domain-containing protein n=1 Tax=Enterococcus faecalis TaxID=1351 RepID=UPI003D6B4611
MEQELRNFFQTKVSYQKVMTMAAKKYYQYGKFTGTISLVHFTETEQAEIADFLGCSLAALKEKKKFSLKKWQSVFEKSRFKQVPFEQAVELVTEQSLQTKEEVNMLEQEEQVAYCQLFSKMEDLSFVGSKRRLDFYRKKVTVTELAILAQLFQNKPKQLMYLPVFAEKELGNPHGLDRGSRIGGLFYTLLGENSQVTRDLGESPTEYRSRLYESQNLVVDDVMNFVTIGNLLGKTKQQQVHPMWQSACDYQVIWNVPIKALLDMQEVSPKNGNQVFIFENSSLYSALLTEFPDLPAICHQGQFRLAMWRILALFPESTNFYYASDMDPEGLQMADKIKKRYGERVTFLYMNVKVYQENLSEEDVSRRLSKLDSLEDVELKKIAVEMKKMKVASYQERIYNQYVAFIRTYVNKCGQ